MRAARLSLIAVGAGTAAFGLIGLLVNASQTHPANWLTYAVGGLLAHDALLVPLTAAVSVLLVRALPARARAGTMAALFIAGSLVLVAIPVLSGKGRLANNPSILPSHRYALDLLIAVAITSVLVAIAARATAQARGLPTTAMNHLRVLRPMEGVYAFYDGRVEGHRFSDEPNWVDGGALSLGIASYAIVDGREALVYDTHVSVDRARQIRSFLEAEGVTAFTVVLSHWHLDHVAGTEAFADCPVIACERTGELLAEHRSAIEAGTLEGPPAINPLILPTRVFADREEITVGAIAVELIHTHIHSQDASVIWLPGPRVLLCGDTLEDTVTYVDEPEHFDIHLANLQRLRLLGPQRILPNHGDAAVIAAGGYPPDLIDATEHYIRALQHSRTDSALRSQSLQQFIAPSLASGAVHYYAGYEAVHQQNIQLVLDRSQ